VVSFVFEHVTKAVIIGHGGVLYGTTEGGGTSNNGTVFSLTPPGSPGASWTETALYSFAGAPNDGANPMDSPVAIGPGGVLYGTTYFGGAFNNGIVFCLTPPVSPGGVWTETVLYSFTGSPNDGANPEAGVVIGGGGVLYGTTAGGGISACAFGGCGIVFSLKPPSSPGGSWTETVLHSLTDSEGSNPEGNVVIGSDGAAPEAGVAIGSSGELYGTTFISGAFDFGTAFSLTPPALPGSSWTERVPHSFGSSSRDGMVPTSTPVIGSRGVLYGTTEYGGSSCRGMGCGVVFSLIPPASSAGRWTERILQRFNGTDGANPIAGVGIGSGGVLYGTTASGELLTVARCSL
jgi:uncharacterized repeat protein (TIGR03803 family)